MVTTLEFRILRKSKRFVVGAAPNFEVRWKVLVGIAIPVANDFILYGRGGEIATNRLEDQEITVLALHLLQVSLVYINTLMI